MYLPHLILCGPNNVDTVNKSNFSKFILGLADERSNLPRLCFTCETPIKFAFFCKKSFTQSSLQYDKKSEDEDDEKQTSICLIGMTRFYLITLQLIRQKFLF